MLNTFVQEIALVPADDVDAARLGLRLSEEDMTEFRARMRALLDDFAARPDDPTTSAWSVFVAIHADPNRPRPAPWTSESQDEIASGGVSATFPGDDVDR